MSFELSRREYADLYGPTVGDAIRLADTELFAVIEKITARRPKPSENSGQKTDLS